MIVFAAIVPHPPESISGIGNAEKIGSIQKTLQSFEQLRIDLEESDPETIIVISPHADMEDYSFVINSAEKLIGSFSDFGLDETLTYINDIEIADKLNYFCLLKELPTQLKKNHLDYGALIPLYHLTKNIKPKIAHLAFSKMSYDFHFRYGETLQKIIDQMCGKRVAILASSELSHKLTVDAPAGFSPKAQEFDRLVLHYLENNDIAGIMNLDKNLVAEVAECGIRSIVILLGILHGKEYKFKFLSYESPFGIGYLTARLF